MTTEMQERAEQGSVQKNPRSVAGEQNRAVREYLEMLRGGGQRRRQRPSEVIQAELDEVLAALDAFGDGKIIKHLELIQTRMNLEDELDVVVNGAAAKVEHKAHVEASFVNHVVAFSERKNISYAAWREVGVPAKVLREAGMSRSGNEEEEEDASDFEASSPQPVDDDPSPEVSGDPLDISDEDIL